MFSPLMRYFIEVAREGSVRGASEKLHIAASAINRHIIEYEEELGTPLFERLPRGMRLTQAGEILFATAKQLQRDYALAVSEVGQLMQSKRGHASLATLTVFAEDFVPPVVHQLLADFPNISYSFVVRSSVDAAQLVADDIVDLALAYDPPLGSPVRILKSMEVPFGVVMRPSHALARKHSIRLEECLPYPLIFQRFGEMRDKLNRLAADMPEPIHAVVESESAAMFRELVLMGTGIGFVSFAAVQHEVSRGELAFRPFSGPTEISSRLCLYCKERRELPVASQLLAERLIANFPPEGSQFPVQTSRATRVAR